MNTSILGSSILKNIVPGMALVFVSGLLGQQVPAPEAKEEVLVLSPFVVTSESDVGYQATQTLAGTRLRTELKDVGAALQVFTSEFFADTGATNAATTLSYGLNTEVGGVQGNYTGAATSTANRSDTDEARTNPQANQRVRGIGSATLTRNFFLTEIPFDTYNSSRLTINRGPNSILFGVGSPSGIFDNSLTRASLGKDMGEVNFRFGGNGSNRQTINFNTVLIKNRLAIRLAALNESENYNQRPAFTDNSRVFADLEAVLFTNKKSTFMGATTLRANFESGEINSNPPLVIPPKVTYNDWWAGATTDFTKYTGVAVPTTVKTAANGGTYVPQSTISVATASSPFAQRPFFFAPALVFPQTAGNNPTAGFSVAFPNADGYVGDMLTAAGANGTNFRTYWTKAFETSNFGTGFAPPVLQNRATFDYRNNLFSGNSSYVQHKFNVYNASLEQLFFKDNHAGVELAVAHEDIKRNGSLTGSDAVFSVYANSDVSIDLMTTLPNGEPNPNVGRAVIRINNFGQSSTRRVTRDTAQATGFYSLDFSKKQGWMTWLGDHTVTGLVARNERQTEGRSYSMVYSGDSASKFYAGGLGNNANANVTALVYLNNVDARTLSGPDKVTFGAINIAPPQEGQSFEIVYQDLTKTPALRKGTYAQGALVTQKILNSGNIDRQVIDSRAIALQSSFLEKKITTIFGWRSDKSRSYASLTPDQLNALNGSPNSRDANGIYLPQNFILQDAPSSVQKGSTFTSSAVAHLPAKWTAFIPFKPEASIHYGQSENFDPSGTRKNAGGEDIASPLGKTREMGFSLDFGSKLFFRVNWFEAKSDLAAIAGLNPAGVAGRVGTFFIDRGVIQPQKLGWSWAQTKAEILRDINGNPIADSIPTVNSYEDYTKLLIGLLPADVAARYNFQVTGTGTGVQLVSNPISNQVATNTQTAKGVEFELVTSPVQGLRIMLNVGKQETITANSAADAFALANTIITNMGTAGIAGLRDSPNNQAPGTFADRYTTDILTPIVAARIKDGTVSQEQRKWRANLVANYSFSNDSRFKGFGVGAAARWQDKAAIGYNQLYTANSPTQVTVYPDLAHPYFAPSQLNGDLWISYRRKLTSKINWRIQLNMRNAFGDHSDIPVRSNPDGSVPIIRIPQERAWFINNTFSF